MPYIDLLSDEMIALVRNSYCEEIKGASVPQAKLLQCFYDFLGTLNGEKWDSTGACSKDDLRRQTLARLDVQTASYYLSVSYGERDPKALLQDAIDLNGENLTAKDLAGYLRSTTLRLAWLDGMFFSIDHLIGEMNEVFNFAPGGNKNKQQMFAAMLKHFNLDTKKFIAPDICKFLTDRASCPPELTDLLKNSQSSVTLMYPQAYEYLVLLRNALHNNGYLNKNMNNKSFGDLHFHDLKEDKHADCFSLPHLMILFAAVAKIVEEVCEASFSLQPHIEDKYLAAMNATLSATKTTV